MAARLGPDDEEVFLDPHPRLLREISGIEPESRGLHVLLQPIGVRSSQRLALSGYGGELVAALWPAELKPQAEYLYGGCLGTPLIAEARALGWTADANPHLAFRNAAPPQRLYMRPSIDAAEYAGRWEAGDLDRVGQFEPDEIRTTLWPWLLDRGYLERADASVLEDWVNGRLGSRAAYLRAGLRLQGRYSPDADGVAAEIRADVNAILAAAHEPSLPARG